MSLVITRWLAKFLQALQLFAKIYDLPNGDKSLLFQLCVVLAMIPNPHFQRKSLCFTAKTQSLFRKCSSAKCVIIQVDQANVSESDDVKKLQFFSLTRPVTGR